MDSDKVIGFIRGVAYSVALLKEYNLDADQLLKESGISVEDLLKYADEQDLKILGLIEKI